MFLTDERGIAAVRRGAAFTLTEVLVAVTLVGVGIAATIGTLTKLNSFASMSRNSTGAYTAVMNQIDLLESIGPFNPQKLNEIDSTPQIPPDLVIGVRTKSVPIYEDPKSGVVVVGSLKTEITDAVVPPIPGIIMYRAVVTVTYRFLDRPGKPQYSFSMTTLRASDS